MEECNNDYAYECENSIEKFEEIDDDLDLIDEKVKDSDFNEHDKKNDDEEEESLSDNIQVVGICRTNKGIILSDYLTRNEYKNKLRAQKNLQLFSSSNSDSRSHYKNKVAKTGEIKSDKDDCILDSDEQVKYVHSIEDENTILWTESQPNDTLENIETKPTNENKRTN